MKIAIIEDETAAAVKLASILAQVCPDGEVVCVLESVGEPVNWFV